MMLLQILSPNVNLKELKLIFQNEPFKYGCDFEESMHLRSSSGIYYSFSM